MTKLINLKIVLFIFVLTIFASLPLLHTGYYTSHDGAGHLARLVDYDQAIRDGQIPVRIAYKVEFGIGYPYFYFNYPLPYIVAETFHLLGLSFVDSWKAVGGLSFLLSGLGMFVFLQNKFGKFPSLFGAVLYMFIPYHFANVYVRGNFPEALSLSLVPWVFAAFENLIKKERVVPFGVMFGVFVLSHNTTVAVFTPVILLYLLLIHFTQAKKIWKKIVISFFLGLALSAFFWVPALVYQHDIFIYLLRLDYPRNFIHPDKLIYSPWSFGGSNVGVDRGEMSLQVGIVPSLIFLLSSVFFLIQRYRKDLWPAFFIFIVIFSLILMIDPIGRPFWQIFSFLQTLQFPWRILGLTTFAIACLGSWFLVNLRTGKLRFLVGSLLILLLFYAARNQIRVNQYTNPDLNYDVYPQSSTGQEHLPIWSSRQFLKKDEWDGTVIGSGESQRLIWRSNLHVFNVIMKSDGLFKDNTVYMPGWRVYVDGEESKIQFLDSRSLGRLLVAVTSGNHRVNSQFSETNLDIFADAISIVGLLSVLYFALKEERS